MWKQQQVILTQFTGWGEGSHDRLLDSSIQMFGIGFPVTSGVDDEPQDCMSLA